jgi:hypothetical protein
MVTMFPARPGRRIVPAAPTGSIPVSLVGQECESVGSAGGEVRGRVSIRREAAGLPRRWTPDIGAQWLDPPRCCRTNGPGSAFYSPCQVGTARTMRRWRATSDEPMDRAPWSRARSLARPDSRGTLAAPWVSGVGGLPCVRADFAACRVATGRDRDHQRGDRDNPWCAVIHRSADRSRGEHRRLADPRPQVASSANAWVRPCRTVTSGAPWRCRRRCGSPRPAFARSQALAESQSRRGGRP